MLACWGCGGLMAGLGAGIGVGYLIFGLRQELVGILCIYVGGYKYIFIQTSLKQDCVITFFALNDPTGLKVKNSKCNFRKDFL